MYNLSNFQARWIPDEGELECTCSSTNNELTFGNSFYVPPNSIDFSSVFLKFSPQNQAAVLSVLIIVIVIYILVVIWARRQDKKDLLKVIYAQVLRVLLSIMF